MQSIIGRRFVDATNVHKTRVSQVAPRVLGAKQPSRVATRRPSTLSLHFGHTHVHYMCKDACSIDANIMTILSLTHITDEWPRELQATETLIRSTACCKCSSPSKMLDMQIRIAGATTRDMKLILRHLIRHIALHAQRPAQKRTQTTLACRELLLQDALEIRTA